MSELIDRQALIKQLKDENIPFNADINEIINIQPIAYDIDNVISEVKKLDLDGVSMVEDGKYKLVRKNEVISLIQNNDVRDGDTINPFNETVDSSGICPTITTRPEGFKTAILVVEESKCVNCDECEHRSEDCLCDISNNEDECPLIKN